MPRPSTKDVARALGIARTTLQKWIDRNLIGAPPITYQGRRKVRLWSAKHVRAAQRFKAERDRDRRSMAAIHAILEAQRLERKAKRLAKKKSE